MRRRLRWLRTRSPLEGAVATNRRRTPLMIRIRKPLLLVALVCLLPLPATLQGA